MMDVKKDLVANESLSMVRQRLYSVRDDVAGEFGPLFQCGNDAVALREFRNLLERVSPRCRADYSLHSLAYWYPETGEIVPCTISLVSTSSTAMGVDDEAE